MISLNGIDKMKNVFRKKTKEVLVNSKIISTFAALNKEKWQRKIRKHAFRLFWNAPNIKQAVCQEHRGILLPRTGKIPPRGWN